jgi:hypothetical protein
MAEKQPVIANNRKVGCVPPDQTMIKHPMSCARYSARAIQFMPYILLKCGLARYQALARQPVEDDKATRR